MYYDPVTGKEALQESAYPTGIPDLLLPAGQTWVQVGLPIANDQNPAQLENVASADGSEAKAAPKKERRTPRPPNPFIIYRSERHKTVAAMHPDLSNNEICKLKRCPFTHVPRIDIDHYTARRLGRQWQAESEEVRKLYRAKAAELKDAFMKAHPEYKYQPRKPCQVQRRKKKSSESQVSTPIDSN